MKPSEFRLIFLRLWLILMPLLAARMAQADWTSWPLGAGQDAVISADGGWVIYRVLDHWQWNVKVLSVDSRLGAELAGIGSPYAALLRERPSAAGPLSISDAGQWVIWDGHYLASTTGDFFVDLLDLAQRQTGSAPMESIGAALAASGARAILLARSPATPGEGALLDYDIRQGQAVVQRLAELGSAEDTPTLFDMDDAGVVAALVVRSGSASGDGPAFVLRRGTDGRWTPEKLPIGDWSQVRISGDGKRLALIGSAGRLASYELGKPEVHLFPPDAVGPVTSCDLDFSGRRVVLVADGIPWAIAFRGTVPVRIMDTHSARSISLSGKGTYAAIEVGPLPSGRSRAVAPMLLRAEARHLPGGLPPSADGQIFVASSLLEAPPAPLGPSGPAEPTPSPLQELIAKWGVGNVGEGLAPPAREQMVSSGIVAQDPQTGWALYRSEQLGISFRLPPNWTVQEEEGGASLSAQSQDGKEQLVLSVRDDGGVDLGQAARDAASFLGTLQDVEESEGELAGLPARTVGAGLRPRPLPAQSGDRRNGEDIRVQAWAAHIGDRILTVVATWPADSSSEPPDELAQAAASIRLQP